MNRSWEHNLETKISCRPTEYFCVNLPVHKHIVFYLTMVLNSRNNVCHTFVVASIVGHGCYGFLQISNSKSSFKQISCSCLTFPARSARLFFPPLLQAIASGKGKCSLRTCFLLSCSASVTSPCAFSAARFITAISERTSPFASCMYSTRDAKFSTSVRSS